ncbi:MAG: roadblock/LC7 domain-containing protein [candidate division WOR-3 bacterium]
MNEKGLRPDVNSLDVLISLADLYVENGLIDEAKDLLKTAIEENKEEIKPYSILSKIYIDQGEESEAAEVLKNAMKINPEDKEIKKLLKSLDLEKDVDTKEKKKKPRSKLGDSLNEVLNNLLQVRGIIGVLIVDDIGALIEAKLELPLEKESTGAIISSIFDKIRFSSPDLDLGIINKVFFELPGGNIIVMGSKSLRFIVLTAKNILIGEVENILTEAFHKTIELLGVE